MTEKIRSTHRERTAYVYVRQSTAQQVRHHQEGQQRQYAWRTMRPGWASRGRTSSTTISAGREAAVRSAPASPGSWPPSAKGPRGRYSRSKPRGWPGTIATGII
jgi:hypothetical protein